MSARRRRGARDTAPEQRPVRFRLRAHEESLITEEGRELSGRGYIIADAHTGDPLSEDDFFFRIGGGIVCDLDDGVAHLDTMQSPDFRPGASLALIRQEEKPDEHPVIEVRDAAGGLTVGRLPAEVAEAVAFQGTESYTNALCLWEWRTESGQRFALRLLLAPGWTTDDLPDGSAD